MASSDTSYATQMVPTSPALGNRGSDCCSGGGAGGAAGASNPQDWRPQFASSGTGAKVSTRAAAGGRSCKCWWVALGAVVVFALVAK
jgi:hypothetical protein